MTHTPRNFVIADPRDFDGDCFEVADRAVAQLQGLLQLTEEALDPARLMARNSELERQCQRDENCDAIGWDETAEGKRWSKVRVNLGVVKADLGTLRRVAGYNPKRPPKTIA